MEEYVDKKPGRENGISRRGSSTVYREKFHEDRSTKKYTRLEGSIRHNSITSSQMGMREKFKYTRTSSSVSGKALAGCSYRPISTSSSFRRPLQEGRDQSYLKQFTLAESSNGPLVVESSSREEYIEGLDIHNKQGSAKDLKPDDKQEASIDSGSISANIKDTGSAILPEGTTGLSSTCTTAASSRTRKQGNGRLNPIDHNAPSTSVARRSTVYRSSRHTAKPASQVLSTGSQNYGLKNLGCTSVSDVFPSGCSPDSSAQDSTRLYDGEISSKSRYLGASSSRAPASTSTSCPALSIPQRIRHQTRIRNLPNTRDAAVSVRTRRVSETNQTSLFIQDDDDRNLPLDEPVMIPRLQQTQFPNLEVPHPSSSRSFTMGLPHEIYNSSGRLSSSSQHSQIRMVSRHENNTAQTFHSSSENGNGYRRFNTGGVTEVLLALEQIEQDAALSYEQLLMLETTFLLSGLNFHDQHRDMRMDIDNMTYEELLALEEKIGNVSTALSEEQSSKCLKRSVYASTSLASLMFHGKDDIKCSICQEEYVVGDEVGNIGCGHCYHVACIQQWLQQKNWCPICKSAALPS